MATHKAKDPWNRSNPKTTGSKLSSKQKASAKARARRAGRPYPNLVDNMNAAKSSKKKRSAKKR